MAIDPICGMTVDETTARSAGRDGETFYFCGEGCRRKFLGGDDGAGHPSHARHTPPRGAEPAGEPVIYTCPMHPQIEQVGPGSCPICGMDLEPKTAGPGRDEDTTELQTRLSDFYRSHWR